MFNINGGCKSCSECSAEPNIIKVDCSVCLACEGLPDMLRWDDERLERERVVKLLQIPDDVQEPERREKLLVIGGE